MFHHQHGHSLMPLSDLSLFPLPVLTFLFLSRPVIESHRRCGLDNIGPCQKMGLVLCPVQTGKFAKAVVSGQS